MMQRTFASKAVACAAALVLGSWLTGAHAQNQTATVTPLAPASDLPFRVEVRRLETGAMALPTLHSFAAAEYDGKWILFGGRTNGMHGFETATPALNFPASSQNLDVWVIDPVTRQTWSRSLGDGTSGLSAAAITALTTSHAQSAQKGDRFYIVGGYSIVSGANGTLNTLTAITLPGMLAWAMGGPGTAAPFVRQSTDPLFTVTGGHMLELNNRMQLIMGNNFVGEYLPTRSGTYTRQIRSFDIVDDGVTVAAANWVSTPTNNNYRRRDLNVVPQIRPDGANGVLTAAAALSGVFTPTDGAWTVPVSIDPTGTPSMAVATAATTFKQGFNGYETASLGLYGAASRQMHTLLLGGMSLQYLNEQTGQLVTDNQLPFVNDLTAVSLDENGAYSQRHLGYFPFLTDSTGARLRFGTNAKFFVSDGVPTYPNHVIKLDGLAGGTRLGYVFGGLVSNAPNTRGVAGTMSAASNQMFEVLIYPRVQGDLDWDGTVGCSDLRIVRASIGKSVGKPGFDPRADTNADGVVDLRDLTATARRVSASTVCP